MPDKEEKGLFDKLVERFFPPATLGAAIKKKVEPPKKKPETEEQRKQRLARQALLARPSK